MSRSLCALYVVFDERCDLKRRSVLRRFADFRFISSVFNLGFSFLIETVVADVHADVGTDHQEVEHIEDQNVPLLCERCHVCLIDELGRDARDVAEEDQTQKHQAFALCGSTLIGFEDVDGPGNAEADDHNDFKNFAHLIIYLSFL